MIIYFMIGCFDFMISWLADYETWNIQVASENFRIYFKFILVFKVKIRFPFAMSTRIFACFIKNSLNVKHSTMQPKGANIYSNGRIEAL